MVCCKAKVFGGWCANEQTRKADDGKEYCVFHAPVGQKGISKDEFEKRVFERIDKCKEDNIGCDLSGTVFEWDISFSQYNKDKPLPTILFALSNFIGEVDFYNTTFSGEAFFLHTKFDKEINFNTAVFMKEANFMISIFSADAIFINIVVNEKIDFRWANFHKLADYRDAQIYGYAYFMETRFSGIADFRNIFSTGEILFIIDFCIKNAIYWYPRRMPVCDQRVPPKFFPTAAVGHSDFWMRG